MRTTGKPQMLTTDRVDINGNTIPPEVIEWEMFDANPVLLYDRVNEGHYGVVIGKVIDRKRIQSGWVGELNFMERFEDADIAYEKYSQGVLKYVSIGGYAVGEEKDGVFYVLKYRVREFSLVKFPANMDCVTLDASALKNEEKKIVETLSEDGKEVRYLTMGINLENEQNVLNASNDDVVKDITSNTDDIKEEITSLETPIVSSTEEKTTDASVKENVNLDTEKVINASNDDVVKDITSNTDDIKEEITSLETPIVSSTEEKTTDASVKENVNLDTEKVINASTEKTNAMPDGMEWHERNNSQINNQIFMEKSFKELNCDASFQKRMNALNSAYRSGAKKADSTPENAETVVLLASSMLQDADMVILANATNITDGITQERRNGLEILVDCAAGGATAATLAAADLGVIKYLSLFYEKLLANDTFRRAIRFVPMSDRTGSIYVEAGVSVPTYIGNVTPINAPRYFYDDIKRTLARRVFAFSPITFQHADLAVLAYNKQSLGISTALGSLMQDISTYWLQVIANTADITRIGTSGTAVSSATLFPLEAPNSNKMIKKPTLDDIINLEGAMLMQNYSLNDNTIELVLPARIYSMLAGDEDVRSRLTRELSAKIGSQINFSATRVTPRNPVARFNMSTNQPELDPSMYADNNVADDGTFSPIVPAVTTADHIGAGVAFVENQVLAGIGAIELISMPDPQNYGTTISGWVSTGATVARQNGVGAALLVPTEE